MTDSLSMAGQQIAELLAQRKLHVVFAESCTAGLVSATLAETPGISQWHCGSAVTYRETTKTAWLGIPASEFEIHNVVSEEIARQMAAGVLRITPEADIAAAVTGHLGPQAPPELDGVAYIAVAQREDDRVCVVGTRRCQLQTQQRQDRQREATLGVLQCLEETLRT